MSGLRKVATSFTGSIITALLGLGFVISVVLLVLHVYKEEKHDYTLIGELLLVAVLSLEGIVAVNHLRQSKIDSLHILLEVLQDYRSAEMMMAVISLWKFRQRHGDRFVKEYMEQWRSDEERIAQMPPEEQVVAMQATLHYRRRIVKDFYNLLAGLYELKVLPKEVIYTYWSAAELKIIPEILIPLETAVANELRTENELGGWHQRLRRLHNDRATMATGTIIAPIPAPR